MNTLYKCVLEPQVVLPSIMLINRPRPQSTNADSALLIALQLETECTNDGRLIGRGVCAADRRGEE